MNPIRDQIKRLQAELQTMPDVQIENVILCCLRELGRRDKAARRMEPSSLLFKTLDKLGRIRNGETP